MSLTEIIRNAYIDTQNKTALFNYIEIHAEVSRDTAKCLAFSFLYHPSENTLLEIKRTGTLPNKWHDTVIKTMNWGAYQPKVQSS